MQFDFAISSAKGESVLPVAGKVAAGHSLATNDISGKAVRIFTGAAMPDGMDTVFMQEDCRVLDDGSVALPAGLGKGANRRLRGEDVQIGEEALSKGAGWRPRMWVLPRRSASRRSLCDAN